MRNYPISTAASLVCFRYNTHQSSEKNRTFKSGRALCHAKTVQTIGGAQNKQCQANIKQDKGSRIKNFSNCTKQASRRRHLVGGGGADGRADVGGLALGGATPICRQVVGLTAAQKLARRHRLRPGKLPEDQTSLMGRADLPPTISQQLVCRGRHLACWIVSPVLFEKARSEYYFCTCTNSPKVVSTKHCWNTCFLLRSVSLSPNE